MLTFNTHFILALLVFCIELFIALFVKDNFVRPYLGDVLVVVLLYCLIKSFIRLSVKNAVASVLVFSIIIEFLQLIGIVNILGLEKNTLARTIIGTSFSWLDILAYIGGAFLVLILEKATSRKIIIVT